MKPPQPETPLWICVQCMEKRGFRVPPQRAVKAIIDLCDHCNNRGYVLHKQALWPAWKDSIDDED